MPFVVTAVVVAAIASSTVSMVRPSEPRLVFRSTHLLPDGRSIRSLTRRDIAISPDGRRLVYNGTGGLYLRDMDALDERIISGTEDALQNPVFSPDGQSVAYFQNGQLRRLGPSRAAHLSRMRPRPVPWA